MSTVTLAPADTSRAYYVAFGADLVTLVNAGPFDSADDARQFALATLGRTKADALTDERCWERDTDPSLANAILTGYTIDRERDGESDPHWVLNGSLRS